MIYITDNTEIKLGKMSRIQILLKFSKPRQHCLSLDTAVCSWSWEMGIQPARKISARSLQPEMNIWAEGNATVLCTSAGILLRLKTAGVNTDSNSKFGIVAPLVFQSALITGGSFWKNSSCLAFWKQLSWLHFSHPHCCLGSFQFHSTAKTATGVCHPDLANIVPTCRHPLRDQSHDFIIYMVHIVIFNTAVIMILM